MDGLEQWREAWPYIEQLIETLEGPLATTTIYDTIAIAALRDIERHYREQRKKNRSIPCQATAK